MQEVLLDFGDGKMRVELPDSFSPRGAASFGGTRWTG